MKGTDREKYLESYNRSFTELNLLCAAYPEEVSIFHYDKKTNDLNNASASLCDLGEDSKKIPLWFPLIFTFLLRDPLTIIYNDIHGTNILDCTHSSIPGGANITIELPKGYPAIEPLQIISYRIMQASVNANSKKTLRIDKEFLERTVNAMNKTCSEYFSFGQECVIPTCSVAVEIWSKEILHWYHNQNHKFIMETTCYDFQKKSEPKMFFHNNEESNNIVKWVSSSRTISDRKSIFQAHICRLFNERMVQQALNQLLRDRPKLQRATHNIYAYRLTVSTGDNKIVVLHGHEDDGDHGTGSKLLHLLNLREEDSILIVVTQWYGGTLLGSRRFEHIINVARELLVEYHSEDRNA